MDCYQSSAVSRGAKLTAVSTNNMNKQPLKSQTLKLSVTLPLDGEKNLRHHVRERESKCRQEIGGKREV